jgi:hypothetical protein
MFLMAGMTGENRNDTEDEIPVLKVAGFDKVLQ